MSNHKIVCIIIPQKFNDIFEKYLLLVDNDEAFKKVLATKITDKRLTYGKFKKMISLKVRYAISYYVSQHIKKIFKPQNIDNHTLQNAIQNDNQKGGQEQ